MAIDQFRAAIASGAFWRADELLVEYRREVEQRWQAATSDQERRAIKAEVDALLEWARRMTLIRRSQIGTKLGRVSSQSAYGAPREIRRVVEING